MTHGAQEGIILMLDDANNMAPQRVATAALLKAFSK